MSNARAKPCICTAGSPAPLALLGPSVAGCRKAPATSSSGSSRSFAYAQRCDQRVRAGARVEDPSFSGVFLGALSTLNTHAYAGCARRDVAGELLFRGDRHVDVVLRVSLACARIGVGAENPVHPAQAAIRYSWIRPPRRSVLRSRAGSTSPISAGGVSSAEGARWSRERCGRWTL